MFTFIVLAYLRAMSGPDLIPVGQQITVSWNQSPTGAGRSRLPSWDGSDWDTRLDDSNWIRVWIDDGGEPQVLINTPGALVSSAFANIQARPIQPGFVLTTKQSAPLKIVFTATAQSSANSNWSRDGTDVIVTITSP